MLTIEEDALVFGFPEVHEKAKAAINFQITLRIPDDTKEYPLPPGLGRFPLRHAEDFKGKVPKQWVDRGGVMLPMHKAEAMWIAFDRGDDSYPCAVKIAAGKINAVSGKPWSPELDAGDTDYLVMPQQPWLDGFAVGTGQIRQFVAMPLGGGYTAEEQITGKAEWGGLQIIVYPMKRERWEEMERIRLEQERLRREEEARCRAEAAKQRPMLYCLAGLDDDDMARSSGLRDRSKMVNCERKGAPRGGASRLEATAMGLGAGGRMRQEVYRDSYGIEAWDQSVSSRCFLTLVDAEDWAAITGEELRRKPPTAQDYAKYGLPWFDYAAKGQEALAGAEALTMLKTVGEVAEGKGLDPLPGNETVDPGPLVKLGPDAA